MLQEAELFLLTTLSTSTHGADEMTRAQKAAKKALVEILRDWQDPHGAGAIMDAKWLLGFDADENGHVMIKVRPSRPHCPCCLVDFTELKQKAEGHRKIRTLYIDVADVPDAHRWTEAINGDS